MKLFGLVTQCLHESFCRIPFPFTIQKQQSAFQQGKHGKILKTLAKLKRCHGSWHFFAHLQFELHITRRIALISTLHGTQLNQFGRSPSMLFRCLQNLNSCSWWMDVCKMWLTNTRRAVNFGVVLFPLVNTQVSFGVLHQPPPEC